VGVIMVAKGYVVNGAIVLECPSLRHVEHATVRAQAQTLEAWEKGRQAYWTAMAQEGTEFSPCAEDAEWWKRPSIEDDYADIRMGN
jgi:hypothetical protein